MAIRVSCPCGTSFHVSSDIGGGRALCPQCQRQILVPAGAGPRPLVPIIPLPPPPARRPGPETRLWAIGGLLVAIVLTGAVVFVIYSRSNPTAVAEAIGSAHETAPDVGSSERPAPLRTSPAVRAVAPPTAVEEPGSIRTPEPFLSDRPRVEVVFCLDTTASMGSLLQGAKQKIWAVSNQVLTGRPTPELRIGLVAYRDRGRVEEYVTRAIELSEDLDAIGSHLKGLTAGGGGDRPESVNQALDEALNNMKWTNKSDALRIIFLVGDAAPHMDYKDDVKYPETCKKASERGVIVNTIQCGTDAECRKHWQEVAKLAGGRYVQIAQTGGVVVTTTPFDDRLVEINKELARSILVYGNTAAQAEGKRKTEEAAKLTAAFGAADRAAYSARNRRVAAYDLLDNIRDQKVKLADLPKNHLPAGLRDLSEAERTAHLEKVQTRREALWKEALDLDRKRTAHVLKSETNKAFDNQVLEMLREQAGRYRIVY